MQIANTDFADAVVPLIAGLLSVVILVALWIPPIVLGVKWARLKGVSPHWMWFGVHPLGAWIAFAVIR